MQFFFPQQGPSHVIIRRRARGVDAPRLLRWGPDMNLWISSGSSIVSHQSQARFMRLARRRGYISQVVMRGQIEGEARLVSEYMERQEMLKKMGMSPPEEPE